MEGCDVAVVTTEASSLIQEHPALAASFPRGRSGVFQLDSFGLSRGRTSRDSLPARPRRPAAAAAAAGRRRSYPRSSPGAEVLEQGGIWCEHGFPGARGSRTVGGTRVFSGVERTRGVRYVAAFVVVLGDIQQHRHPLGPRFRIGGFGTAAPTRRSRPDHIQGLSLAIHSGIAMVNCKVPPSKRSPAHKLDIGNFFFVDDHGAELEACKNCMEHNGQKHPSRFSKQNLCTNGTCQRRVYMNVEGRPLCFKCGTAANQKLTGTTESIAIYSYESQRCSGGCGRRPHFRAEDSGTWCRDCSTREGVPVKPMHDMCSTCASVIPHYTSPTVPGFFCASCAPDDASDPYAHYCPECPDLIRGNFRLDELWYCAPHGRPLGAVKVFDVCAFPGCGLEPRKEADEDGLRRCAKHGGWSAYAFFELLLDFLAEKGLESKFRVQINGVTVTIKLLHSEPQVSFLETLRRLDFLRLLTIDGSSNEKIVDEEEMDEKAHLKNLDDDVARQREVINGTLDFTTRTPEVQAFGARKLFGSFRVAETDPLAEIKKAYTAAARRALPADGTIARPGTTEALRETAEAALRADGFLTVKGKEAVASRSLVKKWFDGHWDKGTVVGESLKKLAKQRAELYAAHLVRVIEFTREVAAADKAAEQGKKRPSTNLAFPITLVGHEPRAVDKFKELEREGIAKVYARPGLG